MAKKKSAATTNTIPLNGQYGAVAPFLLGALVFVVVCLLSASTVKGVTMLLVVLALVVGVVRFPLLRERVGLPMLALALLVTMGGISTLYAVSGKFALNEFTKILSAFSLALILLSLSPKKEEGGVGRWMATIWEVFTALSGLISIDLISTRLISTLVLGPLGLFTPDYMGLDPLEEGIRMISLFGNPNVFASCVGLGVLLSLSLTLSTPTGKERAAHVCCLFVNALAFVLAFSMGASATIAVAFLVYLLVERKERRGALLVLMMETLAVTVVAAALVSMTSFGGGAGIQPVPLLCAIGGSGALWALDRFVGSRISEKLQSRNKLILGLILAVVAALVAFVLLAYNLTGGVSLEKGETLRRAAYPEAGEYTLVYQGSGSVRVTITSQNQQDTMMHTSTTLYEGDLADAAFTVPKDSTVVYFNMTANEAARLDGLTYTGANGGGEIPLGYTLLPGFIANRLQGLWANQNAIQRVVFFADGIKIFQRSPVIGLGLGAFENGIMSVQSFHYETKYAHNHYIQLLAENGVIGLALFVGLLALSAAALWLERRKEEGNVLVPALIAALVFMAGHAATEVIFSFYSYLPIAYGVFILINLCCGESLPMGWATEKVRNGILIALAVLMAAYGILLGGNLMAKRQIEQNPTFDGLEQAIAMDRFEWADYMLSYVNSSIQLDVPPEIDAKADEYAMELAKLDSNTVPIHLAEYYFVRGRPDMAFEMIEKYLDYVASSSDAWNNIIYMMAWYETEDAAYQEGVTRVIEMLREWESLNMGQIELNDMSKVFLELHGYVPGE